MVEPKKGQEKISVSWKEIDEGVKALIHKIDETRYEAIYALPRGGLLLGVMLSHNLDLPLIVDSSKISDRTLIVDDISDSGNTVKKLLNDKECDVAALYERKGSVYKPEYVYKILNQDKWLIFPWEKKLS